MHEFGTPEFERYLPAEERHSGARSAIVIDVHKVSSVRLPSCFRRRSDSER